MFQTEIHCLKNVSKHTTEKRVKKKQKFNGIKSPKKK